MSFKRRPTAGVWGTRGAPPMMSHCGRPWAATARGLQDRRPPPKCRPCRTRRLRVRSVGWGSRHSGAPAAPGPRAPPPQQSRVPAPTAPPDQGAAWGPCGAAAPPAALLGPGSLGKRPAAGGGAPARCSHEKGTGKSGRKRILESQTSQADTAFVTQVINLETAAPGTTQASGAWRRTQ